MQQPTTGLRRNLAAPSLLLLRNTMHPSQNALNLSRRRDKPNHRVRLSLKTTQRRVHLNRSRHNRIRHSLLARLLSVRRRSRGRRSRLTNSV